MATKVVMEALSPTMEEGRLVEWKKQEGEPVAVGDVLAEVETDKAVMELVARAGGTLLKHIVEAGATVPVSEPVAVIGEPGEDGGEAGSGEAGRREARGTRRSAAKAREAQATQPAPTGISPPPCLRLRPQDRHRAGSPPPHGPATGVGQPHRRRTGESLPLAKRMAAERGTGSGAASRDRPRGTCCCPRPR